MRNPVWQAAQAAGGSVRAGWWWAVREVVDAVRYRPPETALALAGAATDGLVPEVAGWLARAGVAWVPACRRTTCATVSPRGTAARRPEPSCSGTGEPSAGPPIA